MNLRAHVLFAALVASAVACRKQAPPDPAAADAAVVAEEAGASDAASAAAQARRADASAPSASDRKEALRALEEGRRKSRAKDYAGALAAFERALAITPEDARVLSEVGWAALQAGDLDRADAANRRALAHAHEPKLRAAILYNAGRVAEARSDAEAARRAYAESLSLRDNAEVKRRLAALGGAPAEPSQPCIAGAPDVSALCACLLAKGGPTSEMTLLGRAPACRAAPDSLSLGTPRLYVVRFGAPEDGGGERVHLLAARDGAALRPVAELGRDFEPGAFGVHNEVTVKGGEPVTRDGRTVHVVRSEQRDVDMNMAGLEACTHSVDRETVCALGEGERKTRCVDVPVRVTSGCGPGVEVDPAELDEETRRTLDDLKKGWSSRSATFAWSLQQDGRIAVRLVEGDASLASAGLVGTHPLF